MRVECDGPGRHFFETDDLRRPRVCPACKDENRNAWKIRLSDKMRKMYAEPGNQLAARVRRMARK